MRCLNRNKRLIWYALYQSKTAAVDADGYETGEPTTNYSDPVVLACNISAAAGESSVEAFGAFADYSNVLCIEGVDTPITETTKLWLYADPNSEPSDYSVKRVAKSLNSTLIAIKANGGADA